MDTHTVRDIGHSKRFCHFFVRQRLLLVEQREEASQEDEATARIEHLMGEGDEVGGDGKLALVGEEIFIYKHTPLVFDHPL